MADPEIKYSRDIIVKITASGVCGSDLHLLDGFIPTMKSGDVLGHEPMGTGRQTAIWRVYEQRANDEERPNAHAALYASCGAQRRS